LAIYKWPTWLRPKSWLISILSLLSNILRNTKYQ
jgi:hypothetical protein